MYNKRVKSSEISLSLWSLIPTTGFINVKCSFVETRAVSQKIVGLLKAECESVNQRANEMIMQPGGGGGGGGDLKRR